MMFLQCFVILLENRRPQIGRAKCSRALGMSVQPGALAFRLRQAGKIRDIKSRWQLPTWHSPIQHIRAGWPENK